MVLLFPFWQLLSFFYVISELFVLRDGAHPFDLQYTGKQADGVYEVAPIRFICNLFNSACTTFTNLRK
jgi:hypothetical protein